MSNIIAFLVELVLSSSRSMRSAVPGSHESVTLSSLCADGRGFGDGTGLCEVDFLKDLSDNGVGVTSSTLGTSSADLSVLSSSLASSRTLLFGVGLAFSMDVA